MISSPRIPDASARVFCQGRRDVAEVQRRNEDLSLVNEPATIEQIDGVERLREDAVEDLLFLRIEAGVPIGQIRRLRNGWLRSR
jgi:hypothetical protein